MSEKILNLKSLYEVKKRIENYIIETPIIKSHTLSEIFGVNLYFKCEFLQEVGSFKIRGVANKILKALERKSDFDLLVTGSSGNHGIALAYLAKKLGKKAVVFTPKIASRYKMSLIEFYGGEVIMAGNDNEQANRKAEIYAKERNGFFVHSYDDLEVIEGHATIALEILDVMKNLDYVIIPVGGGGLIAGVSYAIKELQNKIKVIGVQPKSNPSLYNAIKLGKIVKSKKVNTIAEGLAAKRIGELVFQIVVKGKTVDEVALVSEENIIRATKLLLLKERLLIEPSGAAGLAYLIEHQLEKKSNVLVILTGRNISNKHLEEIFGYSGSNI